MERKKQHKEIEEEIILLLKRKSPEAVKLIALHYRKALFGIIFRVVSDQALAEDAWQESLVKFWKYADRYDSSKGRLFTWMLNICRRTAIDVTRSKEVKHQQKIQSTESIVNVALKAPTVEQHIDGIGVQEFVKKLEPKYREVIDIIYFQGYTQSEAAEALGIPLGTLKTRVRKAMDILKSWIRS